MGRVRSRISKGVALGAVAIATLFGVGAMGGPAGAGAPTGDCATYLYDTDLYLALIGGPTASIGSTNVQPGQAVTITLSGWQPGSTVDLVVIDSAGVEHVVGSVVIGPDSTGEIVWNAPAGIATGPATLQATGIGCLEIETLVEVPFTLGGTVAPTTTAPTTGQLPVTGSSSSTLLGIGAALLVTGAAAVYGARQKR